MGSTHFREWHNSSTDFNPQQSQQLISSSKKASSHLQDHPQRKTQRKLMYVLIPAPMYETKIYQKERHWPPNI
jgi:hypothetical protein